MLAKHARLLLEASVFLSLVSIQVLGQASNVRECVADYAWSMNSKGQTPCLVASYVQTICAPPVIEVNAIPVGTHYEGPKGTQVNECTCSTVAYSLVSACGGCQGRRIYPWTSWIVNCTESLRSVGRPFPRPIDPVIDVPEWAYMDVTQLPGLIWDPAPARAFADSANTTSSSSTTSRTSSTSSSSSTTSLSTSSSPTTTVANSSSSSSSSNNAGAIAGGVVGGLVFIGIVGLLALWLILRKRKQKTLSDQNAFVKANTGTTATSGFSPPPMSQNTLQYTSASPVPYNSYYYTGSTAASPMTAPSDVYTTGPSNKSSEEVSHFGSLAPPRGYTGAAEV